jgi:predicted enzyme related to lactoylglutathione lyase
MPQGQFCWYDLMTTDTAGAAAFYGSVVGWERDDAFAPYLIVKAGAHGVGGIMTVPEDAAKMGARPCWLGYIFVDDVDAMAARIAEAGGSVKRPGTDIPNVGRFAVVADPQGAVFIVFKDAGGMERPPVPAGTPGHGGWHELHADDLDSAFAFYAGLFGWTKSTAVEMGPMGIYQLFAQSGVDVGGMLKRMPAGPPMPVWLYYFNVDDINAAAARVAEAGGKVVNGPHAVPGGSWILHGLDPQGAMFALVAPPGS